MVVLVSLFSSGLDVPAMLFVRKEVGPVYVCGGVVTYMV